MDDIVNVVEACASLAGIYVSRMGLAAVVDLRIQEVDKYVKSLLCLGAVCICLRILWVVDMLFLVEKAVNEEQESPSDTDPYAEQPQNADDDPETRRRLVPVVLIQVCKCTTVVKRMQSTYRKSVVVMYLGFCHCWCHHMVLDVMFALSCQIAESR